jgi:hypothetical protein
MINYNEDPLLDAGPQPGDAEDGGRPLRPQPTASRRQRGLICQTFC